MWRGFAGLTCVINISSISSISNCYSKIEMLNWFGEFDMSERFLLV